MSDSTIFYASLLLALVSAKLARHEPGMALVTAAALATAWVYRGRPGWPCSGELAAASIFAVVLIAGLPNALGLV
jgi:hypothetical protein